MFDFTTERKAKYYKRAELLLKNADVGNVTVDASQFSVIKNSIVHVYVRSFTRHQVSAKELRKLKHINEYHSVNDRDMKLHRGEAERLFESGYFAFPLEEEDI